MSKPSKTWRKMSEIYKIFAKDFDHVCDFSDTSAVEMYNFESTGNGAVSPNNGFAVGKHWMDATIKMWKEDVCKSGLLTKHELYQDKKYPSWFWDKIGIKDWVVDV